MRTETVEVYSDQTNAVVLRHPARKFPGILVQGDTLHSMCSRADGACAGAKGQFQGEAYEELYALREELWSLLNQYKTVLRAHQIPLPFNEA